jgi:hypothetical protein
MIDRPAPRRYRTASERRQLLAMAALSLGLVMLLMPLFLQPNQRHTFDLLLPLGWSAVALGAWLQWRVPTAFAVHASNGAGR